MQVVTIIDAMAHREALQAAREIGRDPGLTAGRLYAALPDDEKGWVERLWASVEHVLQLAWSQGKARAQGALDAVAAELDGMRKALGSLAAEVQDAVTARLSAYVQKLIQNALSTIRTSIDLGGRELPIRDLSIEQKIKISGSLKVSLEGVCEFVADGELTLSATYGAATS